MTQALNSYSVPTSVVSSQVGLAGGAFGDGGSDSMMSSVSSTGSRLWDSAKKYGQQYASSRTALAWTVMGMVLVIMILLIVDRAVFVPKHDSADAAEKEASINSTNIVQGTCLGVSVVTLGFSVAAAVVK